MTSIPPEPSNDQKKQPARILVLERDGAVSQRIRNSFQGLASLFTLSIAKSLKEARAFLEEGEYDLIIANRVLPDGRGIDILPRKNGLVILPLVILSGNGDEKAAVEMLKSGAIDYIVKSEATFRDLPHIAERALREWDNIQQRKRAERALHESEAKYRLLHESIRDAIATVDMSGKITESNLSFREILGYSEEELLERTFRDITLEKWRPLEDGIIHSQVIPRGYSDIYEKEYQKKDGTIFPVELRTFLIRDANEQPAGMWAIIRDITARRRAEQEVLESEEKYRNLFLAESDAIFLIDRETGTILDVNAAACRLYGFTRDELLRMNYTGVSAEPDLTEDSVRMNQAVIPRRRHKKKDGTIFSVEISVGYFALNNRKIILGTVRDITGRLRMEHQILRERERANNLLDIAGVIILALNPYGIVTLVNKKGCEILDRPREEIIGKNWVDTFIPERIRGEIRAALSNLVSGNLTEVAEVENPVLTRNGQEKTILWNNAIIRDNNGQVIGTLSSGEDITERKRAESELRKKQIQLAAVLDLSQIVNWGFDVATGVFTFDDRFYAFFGTTAEREGGHTMPAEVYAREFVHPDDRGRVADEIRKALATTDPEHIGHIEHRIIRRNGEIRTIIARYTVVMGPEGRVIGTYGANQDITEKKAAETALKESERKLWSIFNNVNDAIQIHDIDEDDLPGKFIEVNDIGCRMLQYTREELLTMSPSDFATDYHSFPLYKIGMNLKTLGHATFETGHRRKDGLVVPVEINAHVTTLAGKTVVVSVVRDITERKAAEKTLEENRIQLTSAMDLARLVKWEFNLATGIFTFDDRFYALYGTTAEREGGYQMSAEAYVLEFVHPADAASVKNVIGQPVNIGPELTMQTENRIIRRDGQVRHILVRVAGQEDRSGQYIVHGSNQDITDLKKAEQALVESETKFRSIFNNSSDMQFLAEITASGMPGRILDVNEIAAETLGYAKEELLRMELLEINVQSVREHVPSIMVEVLSKGHASFESAYIRKDRSTFPVEVGVHSVKINGKLVGVSSSRDITERKRQEQALRLSNQKLQLMNIVAWHDIQNKVTGLRGYVELSKDLVADAEVRSFIEKEEEVLKVIHQQIQYTKEYQEMGVQPPRWVNLPEILHRVMAFGKVPIPVSIDLGELELFCDPVIEKVFSHLIRNTVNQDPPATSVRISCGKEEGGTLRIVYEDDSRGVPADQKDQIFIRDVGKSTSFDLFFVHDILQLADMRIRETGEYGRGARFEITVPAGNFRFSLRK